MRFIVALISFLGILESALARPVLPVMVEPVFGLSLPAAIYVKSFDVVPDVLLRDCGVAVSSRAAYRDWIMASVDEPSGRYYLFSGLLRESATAVWQDDPNGAFVRVTAAGCQAIDPALGVFSAVAAYADDLRWRIPEQVFADLAADAVRREVKAFGSKKRFLEALRAQHRMFEGEDGVLLSRAIADAR